MQQWLFSHYVCFLIVLPLKTAPLPLLPSIIFISSSSLWLLFVLQWNFDARPLPCYQELNMPCPDLLSAVTFIPLASTLGLKPLKILSSWKTHHTRSHWTLSNGYFLFFCFLFFSSLCAVYWLVVFNIFMSSSITKSSWSHLPLLVKTFSVLILLSSICLFKSVKVSYHECEIFSVSVKRCHSFLDYAYIFGFFWTNMIGVSVKTAMHCVRVVTLYW